MYNKCIRLSKLYKQMYTNLLFNTQNTFNNTTNSNNMDPIMKLSEILAKSLNTKDEKRSLSSIQIKSLPKLLNCQTHYVQYLGHLFKKRLFFK